MSMSSKRDKAKAKAESEAKRQQAKSSRPYDNYGDHYVTGLEKMRTQGKGDKYRVLDGWYSDEMTKKFNKIFEKRQKEWESDSTSAPEFEKKKTK